MTEHAAASSRPRGARRGRSRNPGRWGRLRSLGRLPAGLIWQRAMHAALHPIYVSPLYRRILGQVAGGELRCRPHDPWPGDPVRAQALLSGRYPFAGQVLDAAAPPEGETAAPPWHPPEATRPWHAELHGFAWLRDLRAHNTDDARRLARELVDDWMRGHPGPGRQAWAPAVMGARLTYWLGQHGFFADSAEAGFRIRLTESMTRQARHLQWVLPAGLTGAPLLTAIKGLLYAGLCLPDGDRFRRRALALLERALPQQIHVDGGHVSRSPATHLRVLCDLLDIRATFAAAGLDAPRSVVLAIESMTPILKLLRQGDGGLALFNGADEGARDVIDLAVKRAGLRGKPHQAAPQTGFQRVEAARTLLLVDAGAPPEPGADDAAHAGTLSFELSEGRRRIITNCGAPPRGTSWVQAARTTAAHSTVVVDETNSSELLPLDGLGGGGLGRRPHNVSCRREEAAGAILLDMSHDGYARSHDARHTRRLYLDSGGGDLRGEDVVTGPEGLSVAVRFHLHPEVRAGLVQNGTAVLVRVPNGAGWRLQASGASLSLEESVYFGRADTVRRTQQIVLATRTGAHRTVVKWALKREGEA